MNVKNAVLPEIYVRNGRECYLDPIREKLIYITPEETVRQKVVSHLINELDVPADMITVEERLSHHGVNSNRRADIVICVLDEDDERVPLAVVECKAPDVPLDENAFNQVMKYSNLLNCLYTVVTNGECELCFVYDDKTDSEILIEELPDYENMLDGEYLPKEISEPEKRKSFEEEQDYLIEYFNSCDSFYDEYMSNDMPLELALPIYNFQKCIYDVEEKMPVGDYGMFRLIKDYGVRKLTYGNAAGGKFHGNYRSLLVEVNSSTEFFSIGMSTYWKKSWEYDHIVKTSINIAHDTELSSHHAMQLIVEDNLCVDGDTVDFFHNGRIAVGRSGSGRISELKELVRERCPELIKNDSFYLGRLCNDRLFKMNDPEVTELIKNLISYAIIRDEYREIKKAESQYKRREL